MKKLLGLLGIITIAGSGIPGIVGNAPAPVKNAINYQQTNNLESLNRNKRQQRGQLVKNQLDLKNDYYFVRYLVFLYFYNKYFDQHHGSLNPEDVYFSYSGINFIDALRLSESERDFIVSNKEKIGSRILVSLKDIVKNPSDNDDEKAATTKYEEKQILSNSITTKWSIGGTISLAASIKGVAPSVSLSYEKGEEKTISFSTEKNISLEPAWGVVVPSHKQRTVTREAHVIKNKYTGIIQAKILNPDILSTLSTDYNEYTFAAGRNSEQISLINLINKLRNDYGFGNNLFNSNNFLTIKNNELFANVPTVVITEDEIDTRVDLGTIENIK